MRWGRRNSRKTGPVVLLPAMCHSVGQGMGMMGVRVRSNRQAKTGPLELRGQERKEGQKQHTQGHLEDLQEEERKPGD